MPTDKGGLEPLPSPTDLPDLPSRHRQSVMHRTHSAPKHDGVGTFTVAGDNHVCAVSDRTERVRYTRVVSYPPRNMKNALLATGRFSEVFYSHDPLAGILGRVLK